MMKGKSFTDVTSDRMFSGVIHFSTDLKSFVYLTWDTKQNNFIFKYLCGEKKVKKNSY